MKPNQIEGWEKDFESLWGASFDREGNIEPFEFERLKDFIRQLLETAKKEEREKIWKIVKKWKIPLSKQKLCQTK